MIVTDNPKVAVEKFCYIMPPLPVLFHLNFLLLITNYKLKLITMPIRMTDDPVDPNEQNDDGGGGGTDTPGAVAVPRGAAGFTGRMSNTHSC